MSDKAIAPSRSKYLWQDAICAVKMSPRARHLVSAIFSFLNDEKGGKAYVSIGTLAAKMLVSENTVRAGIRDAAAAGVIRVAPSRGRVANDIFYLMPGERIDAEAVANPSNMFEGLDGLKTPDAEASNPSENGPFAGFNPSTMVEPYTVANTLEAPGRPLRAGPDAGVGASSEVVDDLPTASTTSCDVELMEDAPNAALKAAGAPDVDVLPETLSAFKDRPLSALQAYRSEWSGTMPGSRVELFEYAEEQGLEVTDEDLEDLAEEIGEDDCPIPMSPPVDVEDNLERLRAGRNVDRHGHEIFVPPAGGTALDMLRSPTRRASYVGRVCSMAEQRPDGASIRALWLDRLQEMRRDFLRNGSPPDEEALRELSAEFVAEMDRRRAITRFEIQRACA